MVLRNSDLTVFIVISDLTYTTALSHY